MVAQSGPTRVKHPAEQGFFSSPLHPGWLCRPTIFNPIVTGEVPPPQGKETTGPQHTADHSLHLVLRFIMYGTCTDLIHIKRYWKVESINSVCSADQLKTAD